MVAVLEQRRHHKRPENLAETVAGGKQRDRARVPQLHAQGQCHGRHAEEGGAEQDRGRQCGNDPADQRRQGYPGGLDEECQAQQGGPRPPPARRAHAAEAGMAASPVSTQAPLPAQAGEFSLIAATRKVPAMM